MPFCTKCRYELSSKAKFCPRCGTPIKGASPPNPSPQPVARTPEPELKLAFWGERFLAWLIDVIIMGFLVGMLGLFSSFVTWQPFPFLPGWLPFVNFGFGGFVYFLYWTIMEGIYGQSVGKMVMHLRVAKLDGGHVGMAEAVAESIGKAFFLFLDVLIGWALYPKRRQRVFNYLSGTIVIRE